jgi:large subunit ribosomal protein L2
MPLKEHKPNTPGLRFRVSLDYSDLDKKPSEKALRKGSASSSGRDSAGRISVRRRGGGNKRAYREIDFKRDKVNVPGTVKTIEYDPNRSANIALVVYADGEKRYILAPKGLERGVTVLAGDNAPPTVGNTLPLESVPLGSAVHNIELQMGRGGQLARSAGASGTVVAKEKDYVTVKLPSGETRMIFRRCRVTMGSVGNEDHMNVALGKAGRSRYLGRRPKVRGVVMNPVDHPHGGGEGRTSGGRHPVSPTGVPTKGYKTRKKRKSSSKFIVKRRR